MVFFISAILLCAFILFYVVKLNYEQGKRLREWDWVDWLRILVALYWIFVSVKLAVHATISDPHTTVFPGVVLTLALIAGTSIRKEKRINGNGKH
jgi:hypothetical protein